MSKRIQHIAEASEIAAVFGTGKKVKAICGTKWAPIREGSWEGRLCKNCARRHGILAGRGTKNRPAQWGPGSCCYQSVLSGAAQS